MRARPGPGSHISHCDLTGNASITTRSSRDPGDLNVISVRANSRIGRQLLTGPGA